MATRPGLRGALAPGNDAVDALSDNIEPLRASVRAKVEHPLRVIKRQFGRVKLR